MNLCKCFNNCRDISTLHYINHHGRHFTTSFAMIKEIQRYHDQVMVTNLLVFCVLYVNQSLLIAEIYQHSITSTTLTWLRPPRPSHGLRYEIVWIYLVFCVLYVNHTLLITKIYQHHVTSTTLTCLRPSFSYL